MLAHLAKAVLFIAYCHLLGLAAQHLIARASRSAAGQERNACLTAFFAISTGMGVVTLLLFALGMAALLHVAGTASALAFVLLGALAYLWRHPDAWQSPAPRGSVADGLSLALFLSGLFICLVLLAIKPPGMWDDTMYHLPYARHYLQHHAIVMDPYLRFPLFPHNGNLLFALGLMLGTETDAQVLATLPLTVIALGLLGACQLFLRSTLAGVAAVALLLALGPVQEALGYAYVDNLLALYAWGAALALALWLRDPPHARHWLVICGLLAGSAAGTKLFGGVLAFLIGLYLLLAVRHWRAVGLYAVTTLLAGGGWYLRSFYLSGDPVHPAGGNFFGHYLWNAADLLSQQQEQSTHGAPKSLANLLLALRTAGILLLPAFGAVWLRSGRSRPMLFMYSLFVLYLMFWLFATQVARYLAPLLALGAFLSVFFVHQAALASGLSPCLPSRALPLLARMARLVLAAGGVAVAGLGYRAAVPALAGWDATLQSRAGYATMQAANAQAPRYGHTLLQLGFENAVYFFDGKVIGDWFGPGRYSAMLHCDVRCQVVPAEQLAALMQHFGAQMFAINAARFQFDPKQYQQAFDIAAQPQGGYLLMRKSLPGFDVFTRQ